MNKPQRHQLSRRKGYRKPEGVVVVSRPSKWGNPFETAEEFEKALSVICDQGEFSFTIGQLQRMQWIARNIEQLRNKELACWCSLDKPCHADVLIEYANREGK